MKRNSLVFVMLSFLAVAADARDLKKRTAVTFDDQLIMGETKLADFYFFLEAKSPAFGKLIQLRENFLPEARRASSILIRRSAGE